MLMMTGKKLSPDVLTNLNPFFFQMLPSINHQIQSLENHYLMFFLSSSFSETFSALSMRGGQPCVVAV